MVSKQGWVSGLKCFFGFILSAVLLAEPSGAIESHPIFELVKIVEEEPVTGELSELLRDTLKMLSQYEFPEARLAILSRIAAEAKAVRQRFDRLPEGKLRDWQSDLKPYALAETMRIARRSLRKVDLLRFAMAIAEVEPVYARSEPFGGLVRNEARRLTSRAARRTEPVPSIYDVLPSVPAGTQALPAPIINQAPPVAPSVALQKAFENAKLYLQSRVVGQEQAVAAFATIEERGAMFKERRKPELIMLAGAPATGKDTLVEAYVDYLNGGEKDAWKDGHLFKAPVMRDDSDLWKFLGSNTGYIGSDKLPPLFDFLVKHSGGRYKVVTSEDSSGKKSWKIVANQPITPDSPGMSSPKQGVILFNEFHNWTQEMKDSLKVAMEKGEWEINNPGGGLARIHVPVTLVFATNELVNLTHSIDAFGKRVGKPLSYEKMHEKWRAAQSDRGRLLEELERSNSRRSSSGAYYGYSREWLSRLEGSPIVLMEPHSPEQLQKIAKLKLEALEDEYATNSLLEGIEFEWTPELLRFIQEYDYAPEEMARPISGKVESLVMNTLHQSIRAGLFPTDQGQVRVRVTPVTNSDRTTSLNFEIFDPGQRLVKQFQKRIEATEGDRELPTISEERIKYLMGFEDFLRKNVFGLSPDLVRALRDGIVLADESRFGRPERVRGKGSEGPREGATVIALFGKSSTGKSETGKAIHEFLAGDREPFLIDFSQIMSVDHLKEKILGSRDQNNQPIHSDFMQQYDRNRGDVVVLLDEVQNAKPGVTKALFDFLRVDVVTTFSDTKPRPMRGVKIVISGNVGEEWYNGISRSLPWWVQMYAMREVYQKAVNNNSARRDAMERYFSDAFIARIGDSNTHFFGPHSFKSLRELTQLKLMQMVMNLKPYEGRLGWDIRFASREAFLDFAELVEESGFEVMEQGASIDRYVHKTLERGLKVLLIENRIPRGSTVVLSRLRRADKPVSMGGRRVMQNSIRVEIGERKLTLNLHGRAVEQELPARDDDRYLTALHEAGHAVARAVLLKGLYEPTRLSIIPGVAQIGSDWVHYAGIAESESKRESRINIELVMAEMAVLAAGETAERLATKGQRHDAGKHNDMQRATSLAMRAILRWGLSEAWGTASIPEDMSMPDYVSSLPEKRRQVLNQEVERMLRTAREIASVVLAANMESAVIPLGLRLAEEGRIEGKDLKAMFGGFKLFYPDENGKMKLTSQAAQRWVVGQTGARGSVDAQLVDYLPRPKRVAKYEEIIAADREKQRAQVPLPKDLPLAGDQSKDGGACGGLLMAN